MKKKASKKRLIEVFIASPGDLSVEREAFKNVIDDLNIGFGDGAGVEFKALGWEDTLAVTGRRSQAVINQEVDRCDVFVLALNRRWGQEAPDSPYSSYTEEEFHRALDRWKKDGAPEIFVFFKDIDPASMADPGPQLVKVLEFRKRLEETRVVLYHGFVDEHQFSAEISKHLRAFAKGDLPKTGAVREQVILPLNVIEEIEKERAEKALALAVAEEARNKAEAAATRAEALALEFAERAAKAAMDGKLEEARQDFALAVEGTTNLRILYLAYEFYYRTGNLKSAEEMAERWLSVSGRETESAETAAAYSNLGTIYRTRGNLDGAEKMYRSALAVNEKLGRLRGTAGAYGNLGILYDQRGDLDAAEEMQRKALELSEQVNWSEGLANAYGNLGLIFEQRGDLDEAEKMHRKALEIEERHGLILGMATDYGNLGLIYRTRGDLDEAENMHRKALEIEEKLGHIEGMASEYGNLGVIYYLRGELDEAEKLNRRSLEIEEKLGRLMGMASSYWSLALIAADRGDFASAREHVSKALGLFERVGASKDADRMRQLLVDLQAEFNVIDEQN